MIYFLHVILFLLDRKEKELLKALETPEEKRARRLAKKVNTICTITDKMAD